MPRRGMYPGASWAQSTEGFGPAAASGGALGTLDLQPTPYSKNPKGHAWGRVSTSTLSILPWAWKGWENLTADWT